MWVILLQYILLWRFFEILRAFRHDGFEKLATSDLTSSLTFPQRVTLVLRSDLELILDFTLIYALLQFRPGFKLTFPSNRRR